MTKRIIWEIEEGYSEQATRLLRGWYEGKERIARAAEAVRSRERRRRLRRVRCPTPLVTPGEGR
jgi:hypothetical protein